MKKQERVLNDLYVFGRKETIEEISRHTGLTKRQVYDALTDLKNRHLIRKELRTRSMGYTDVSSGGTLYVEFDIKSIKRIKKILGKKNGVE